MRLLDVLGPVCLHVATAAKRDKMRTGIVAMNFLITTNVMNVEPIPILRFSTFDTLPIEGISDTLAELVGERRRIVPVR